MDALVVNAIRRRVEHSISPTTANAAGDGMTVENIKQFIAGKFTPSDAALWRLCDYLGVRL